MSLSHYVSFCLSHTNRWGGGRFIINKRRDSNVRNCHDEKLRPSKSNYIRTFIEQQRFSIKREPYFYWFFLLFCFLFFNDPTLIFIKIYHGCEQISSEQTKKIPKLSLNVTRFRNYECYNIKTLPLYFLFGKHKRSEYFVERKRTFLHASSRLRGEFKVL